MKNKKILITGGGGFLGSNLARKLLAQGAQVIVCDNFSRRGSQDNFTRLKAEFPTVVKYSVEIADAPLVIAKERPDLVYHFAAQVAVTTSVESPLSDFRINAEGTFNVARVAASYSIPVIYASTNKVYGDNVNYVPLRELETRYDFDGELKEKGINETFSIDASHHTPYGASKLTGEIYIREFGGVANRFSCMYGKHQHGIIDQGWLSYFVIQKLSGKPVTIFGDGKQIRDALHADDVVRLLETQGNHLLDSSLPDIRGQVFSIGGGYKNTLSLLELCKKLEITPSFAEWRPSDQKVFYADITKAKELLGWEPTISLEEGLKDLVEWTKANITTA
jgi:CDP-paratose 2-epimerase